MPSQAIIRAGMELLYYSGASRLLRPAFAGCGAIFMLHHVRPGTPAPFAPNGKLSITPEFLDETLTLVRQRGFDLVSMDELERRLAAGDDRSPPFIAVTLDDGYRDNLEHALPVFRRHRCPFTIYCAPAMTDGVSELWWDALEAVITGNSRVACTIAGQSYDLPTATDAERARAWTTLYWPIRGLDQQAQRQWVRDFCAHYNFDLEQWCRAAVLDWEGLRAIAADPLCTIGAHTINHFALSRLGEAEAIAEIVGSADRIERELGKRPRHLAYPYGDKCSAGQREFDLGRRAGFATAVTTRKGMLFAAHRDHLLSLPRMSLSGEFQKRRYVETLLTGAPFAVNNGFRKLNVA